MGLQTFEESSEKENLKQQRHIAIPHKTFDCHHLADVFLVVSFRNFNETGDVITPGVGNVMWRGNLLLNVRKVSQKRFSFFSLILLKK